MPVRTNLATNPSFETGFTGWQANSVTQAGVNNTLGYVGSASFNGTRTSGAAGAQASALFGVDPSTANSNADSVTVAPGEVITFSIYSRSTTTGVNSNAKIWWQTSGGTYISQVAGASVATNGTWQRLSVTATAPATAGKFGYGVEYPSTNVNFVFNLDAALVEKSSTLGSYFDGSAVAAGKRYAWTGARNASTSTETIDRINLMLDPGNEAATTLWTPGASITASHSTAIKYAGAQSLRLLKSGTGSMQAQFGADASANPNSYAIPVTAGEVYTFSAYIRHDNQAVGASLNFYWMTNTAYQAYSGGTTTTTTATFTRYSVTGTVPAGATKMAVNFTTNDIAEGNSVFIDNMLLEKAASVGTYFDGSNPPAGYSAAWTGTANASTSIASTADYVLDWSIDSVGPTINYGTTPLRYMLDYYDKPAGATSALTWVPEPFVHGTTRSFSLPLTLATAGAISFWAKVSSESGYDGLRFYIDGVQQQFWSGETNWGQVSYNVAAGAHTFMWAYTKDGSAIGGADNAWIALLKVTNVASVPPVQISPKTPALYDFEDGAIPPVITTSTWTNSTNLPISGTRSLRTPATTAASTTYTATIAIPELPENGCVSMDFKTSSESGDRTWFTLDGADYPFFYGEVSKKMAFVIPQMAGTHTLRVEYRKDNSLNQGSDASWIDNLHIPFQVSSGISGTTRTNLMPYPSAETTLGWVPKANTSVISDALHYVGTKSAFFQRSSGTGPIAAGFGSTVSDDPNSDSITVVAGETYTFSAYVYGWTNLPTVEALLIFQTATAYQSYVAGSSVVTTGAWQRVSVTATVPAGAVKMGVVLRTAGAFVPVDTSFGADAFLIEKAGSVGSYFDGSTAAAGGKTYAWTGTANASTSTEFTPAGATTINTSYSGSGTLTTALPKKISSGFSGSGALTTRLSDYLNIDSGFSGSGSLATTLTGYRRISSAFSGTGTLGTSLSNYQDINSQFSGSGTLGTSLQLAAKLLDSDFGSEGVLLADLLYTVTPPPLDSSPLGKLVGYSVFNSAVPLNPEEGSGSAPSVSSSYTKGVDPEFMLGEELELTNPAIGSYTGEVVRVDVTGGSDVVGLSVDTLLGLTNKDLHLAPIIDSDQRWTAARAIDYWTQQAGVFYDAVPGDCAYYASGFGHTNAFTTGNPQRFYDKIYGAADTVLLNGRSVRTFGTDTLSVGAMYNAIDARVPVMLPFGKKMLLSAGIGVRGTGRTASVLWSLESSTGLPHVVDLTVTSAGAVTAKLGNTVLTTATVPANGEYRFTLSIERASRTAVATKLTVHTDDLNGSGTMLAEGMLRAHSYALPGVLQLRSMHHKSDGGSGDQMLRWGTYLSVAAAHPKGLPAVQKVLSQTTRDYPFISGFQGNVWKMLNEFCSIARLDVQFKDRRIHVAPRQSSVVAGAKFSRLIKTAERREKFKQVAVTNHQSKAVTNDQGVLWRADSVYQLNVREVFETTVQTPHSILSVVNPVPVPGITPFPYTAGGGQYVVTGADGYIIAPKWWTDNGGKVEVSLTEKEGEIALKITAPDVDSVRAPYRISEGAADRPALYISGSGVINDPKEVHINTGATHARQGFDSVFTSPFVTSAREVFDVAVRMAHEYSSAVADVQYDLPADFGVPTLFGQYPAGALFTDGERNFRIMEASQTSSAVSGRAVPYTTLGEYKKTYPAGATIADEKARHRGRTIRQFNIKPLRST